MNSHDDLIEGIKKAIKDNHDKWGCLCGHFESCDQCNPFSDLNKLRHAIQEVLKKDKEKKL